VNTLKQLAQLGYVEDRNLRVIVRPVHVPPNETELDEAAKALVDSGAEVLVGYDTRAVLALHKATKRIPIVAGGVSNPVRLGLAKSLRTPGGNVTGLSFGLEESAMLQLKALRLLRPKLKHMMVLISPKDRFVFPENEWAGKEIGVQAEDVVVDDLAAADRILASVRDPAAEAAWVDQFVPVPTQEVAATAIKHRIATHGFTPQAVREGLLLSYWLHHPEAITRLASMIDKVLRGTDPGTLPFELPSAAELAINRNTARAIGVTIPEELTLRATEIVG
jgi:putative ABC transport system substrate-binding protein